LRYKAWLARERGAKALMVVDVPARPASAGPDWKAPEESRFPALRVEGTGDAGIPVVVLRREVGEDLIARGARARVDLEVALDFDKTSAFNVVGLLRGDGSMPGALVIGAHYDHLGMGGPGSLAPDAHAPHLGADDNASGVAVLLETARLLRTAKRRTRDVYFVAFTAEESGVLGSTHFVRHLPRGLAPEKIQAMLNMDMVGRLRNNRLQVLGGDSAKEWQALLAPACAAARIECNIGGDGYGPSDQTPFFAAGIPVLHYFTGAHSDYHKPSDESRKINAAGAGQIAIVIANTASALFARRDPLTLRRDSSAPVVGDMRSSGASLGTIPDYAGPPGGQRGVLLAGVRKGGAAETGGLQRGDILVKLGKHDIGDVRDLMFALGNLKPGESIKAVVLRNKKRLELPVTLQEQRGH